jgi:hypothetical protein
MSYTEKLAIGAICVSIIVGAMFVVWDIVTADDDPEAFYE